MFPTRIHEEIQARFSNLFADDTAICISRSSERWHDIGASSCPQGTVQCSPTDLTLCVKPGEEETCPITDIKIVNKADYSGSDYPGYTIADAPSSLSWLLLVSRSSGHYPIARFKLTEEKPCSIDEAY